MEVAVRETDGIARIILHGLVEDKSFPALIRWLMTEGEER